MPERPFGHDTLVIPFTLTLPSQRGRGGVMSRLANPRARYANGARSGSSFGEEFSGRPLAKQIERVSAPGENEAEREEAVESPLPNRSHHEHGGPDLEVQRRGGLARIIRSRSRWSSAAR